MKADNRQRVRLELVCHPAGLFDEVDLRTGERHGVGRLDCVFGEVAVGAHFVNLYRSLEPPVADADLDLDWLLSVLVEQREIELVAAA